ncbi:MAG TPA: methyltransferase [Thermotogota bacterium]|nr:methyltransferase [Thermotogota bacterium]
MSFNQISKEFVFFQNFLKNHPIKIISPHESNRVNHASVLLLWNSQPVSRVKRFVEMGCGSGFVSFGMAKFYGLEGTGIDIQSGLRQAFEEGAKINEVSEKVKFMNLDTAQIRSVLSPERYDLCLFNPPHYISGRGEKSCDQIRELSRTGGNQMYEQFSDGVSFLLKTKGIFSCVLSPHNLEEWMQVFERYKLFVKTITPVYGNPDNDAQLILIRGIKNSKSSFVKLTPAVFLH